MNWPALPRRSDLPPPAPAGAAVNADPAIPATRGKFTDFLPAALLLMLGLGSLAMAWVATGQPSSQYLVMAPPGSTLGQTVRLIRAAGGGLTVRAPFSNLVIADSTQPDFPNAARKAGAWLAVPVPARAGCAAPSSPENTL
ncbi:hypothetical protein V474_13765 [Novosphingobium barchaimii LL02]|uniref:Uncharacterized protein n=1 Tax=Novosphingobium barchaimii LL02 TaxID=1114963 RepID=A0A0J7XYP9_9SPHN|nr:hypothetical protein [Novosphingobium barchaimii]KMS56612.1 hypothetical protein V474_13765 [Novosphingobium barchaimii LL02]